MAQCAPGKQLAMEPKPTGMALPWKGWHLAGVTGGVACVSLWVCGKRSSTREVFRAGCQSPAPGSGWMLFSLAAFSGFLFGCPYRCLGENESPVLKLPFSVCYRFVICLVF